MDEAWMRAQLQDLHPQSFGWAMCCCRRDRLAAEETLQRAYLKVLDGSARYTGTGAFKTWFFAVIRKTARDETRRQLVRRLCFGRYAANVENTTNVSRIDCGLENEELRQTLFPALNALPARQREVLQLVFYHDLTLNQAAIIMGVSSGSARTHYDRGKKTLRKSLGKLLDQESSNEFGSTNTRTSLVF
jgi:RNA polymerase sigma-70 factor (ECF subfamily)